MSVNNSYHPITHVKCGVIQGVALYTCMVRSLYFVCKLFTIMLNLGISMNFDFGTFQSSGILYKIQTLFAWRGTYWSSNILLHKQIHSLNNISNVFLWCVSQKPCLDIGESFNDEFSVPKELGKEHGINCATFPQMILCSWQNDDSLSYNSTILQNCLHAS